MPHQPQAKHEGDGTPWRIATAVATLVGRAVRPCAAAGGADTAWSPSGSVTTTQQTATSSERSGLPPRASFLASPPEGGRESERTTAALEILRERAGRDLDGRGGMRTLHRLPASQGRRSRVANAVVPGPCLGVSVQRVTSFGGELGVGPLVVFAPPPTPSSALEDMPASGFRPFLGTSARLQPAAWPGAGFSYRRAA